MYCNCTNVGNYKIIGECNPKIYNQKETTAWVQITVPEILPLPDCYPDIEEIDRIYVNVIIESTTGLDTPIANEPNIEGTKLTGKKLMVNGNICETIVYTANSCEQSLHSINFKFPFCTEIVLNKDVDFEFAKFYIKPCVENVFAKAIALDLYVMENIELNLKVLTQM